MSIKIYDKAKIFGKTKVVTEAVAETPISGHLYNLSFRSGIFPDGSFGQPSDPNLPILTQVNEGNGAYTVYIRLSSSLTPNSEAFDNAVLPYTITGVSETDVSILGMEMPLTGTLTLNGGMGGSGDYMLFVAGDHLTEGPERMVITLNGTTPTVSAALLINDTSTN